MAASLKTENMADVILSKYPPYISAMNGFDMLKDFKYPLKEQDKTENAGILSVDSVGWKQMIEFLKSEIAIRKSERNRSSSLSDSPLGVNMAESRDDDLCSV